MKTVITTLNWCEPFHATKNISKMILINGQAEIGNDTLDKSIRNTQLNTENKYQAIEWIPHVPLHGITRLQNNLTKDLSFEKKIIQDFHPENTPEILFGKEESDVYSLGIIAYEPSTVSLCIE
ncbi:hypothetical protein Glove_428g45 [Diversispora epigaea]|uniref:Protein kinase domain-containing protein n=1 Tax=Diversispora epigaea TaxID=1348612 RepID=A0A397GZ69_9GLOM|nr:hypothetical protein Glove_428g45 [Diversispora epigaea]